MLRWSLFIILYILIDLYAFQALKNVTKSKWIYAIYILASLVVLFNVMYQISTYDSSRFMDAGRAYAFGFFITIFIPKLILISFVFGEDVFRFFIAFYGKFFASSGEFHLPSRRKFVSILALTVAAIPFTSLLFGMYKGKYNYKVWSYKLEFDDLPESFDGFQITHISDIHSGSFDDKIKVQYGIDLINEQKSDIILFTGDLVNNLADEMIPWKEAFSKLQAKEGVYSVLGNHDYGEYVNWNNQDEKQSNFEAVKNVQKEMGWHLLLNESHFLKLNDEKIALIGVENWGEGGFKKAGNLDKAVSTVSEDTFKILMSHDPSHWNSKVKDDLRKFHLTLSGHTHGMQFGIEIPGWFKWSPIKYRYEHWAGIYEESGKYINVNRGFGFLGYPGRVGIWPEISVITLKRKTPIV